ncbi:MAG: sugar phosphate isomerase/epimerase [Bacteroidales bacterium]
MNHSRRNFLKQSGLTLAGAGLLPALGASGRNALFQSPGKDGWPPFGFQSWTIREPLNADFGPTLEKMAGLGYSYVEMCSPLGYKESGFAALNELTGKEIASVVKGAGLICNSSHFTMGELRDHLENRIEWARDVGMKQMVCSSFWLPDDATLDDYRRAAGELNRMGEQTASAGLQMVFHNHHMEFEKRGDVLIYDALLEEFDPALVKMQFQVAVVDLGYQAADYFRMHPGRFQSAHLADYSTELEKQVAIGQGVVDWDDFFVAAKTGGVKNFYVEMAPELFPPSAEFLSA